MVKSSNRAQQRRSLPCSGTTIKRGKESAAKQAKQKVNKIKKKKGPHFTDPIAAAYANKIIVACLDEYDKQVIQPGKKRPPRTLESFRQSFVQLGNVWLTLEMLKMKKKNKKKSNNKKESKKNRKPPPNTVDQSSLNEVKASGCPHGTTNATKESNRKLFIKMKNEIVSTWSDKKKRPPSIQLADYIKQVQVEYELDPVDYPVTTSMVHSRTTRNRIEVQGTGQVSPVLQIEPRKQIISWANSHVKDSLIEKDIIAWKFAGMAKLVHHSKWRNKYLQDGIYPERAELGDSWFDGFAKRWKHEVQFKNAQNVAYNRTEHVTYRKFVEMYENVYGLLLKDGYAEPMLHPKYYDKLGNECDEDDIDRFGELVDIRFKHPELVLVADECGTNTNMSKEKMSSGNKKHMSTRGIDAKIPACTSDCHFTTMVWTALTGEPVMAVVIIEKESELTWSEIHGFDIEAEWVGDDSFYNDIKSSDDSTEALKVAMNDSIFPHELLELNTGPGKVFPGGPVCSFKGLTIPTIVRRSASGGITPEILIEVLQHYDKHVPRKEGDPPPAALLDGHGSRLDWEVMKYANNLDRFGDVIPGANHQWNLYLGLPNATAYWQVGDSSEQNGAWKNLQRVEKETIRANQQLHKQRLKIERHHAVYMLQRVFHLCYGNVEGNKNAILERGWNPLNKGCLSMPDVLKSKPKVSIAVDSTESVAASTLTSTASSYINDMNVSTGTSRDYLRILTASVNRDEAREVHHQAVMDEITLSQTDNACRASIIDKLTKNRLTAGSLTHAGIWSLQQTALEIVKTKNEVRLNALADKASKQYIRDMKTYTSGKAAMEKSIHHYAAFAEGGILYGVPNGRDRNKIINGLRKASHWLLNDDYVHLIRYKQLGCTKKASKIPATLAERRVAWDSTYYTMKEPSPPVKPDNFITVVEADNDVEVEEIDIEALSRVNSDLPRTEASVEHFEAAQSLFTLTMTDECADSNYHGGQVWNTQISEI
ncbi:hypothetical protein FRACYDRAFT_254435 [Fragilariopsis cylindrus CCMP1102]|uniref:Uncharacterized protein n=1 Tax=Fragilariopsis cylindrus CCMP1102 TaxID=635003 RepID=A0A1E7EL04_9STRA|nr:hypothetical protein FRACYDRAFT_254435 [Fragilariopsis cylindrus CCMP1102]|eukprot:OEU06566.1 hypothetical protein FRACYDRAFT_254435 [Fragilariopsis cylindrus CCMP1102]